MAAYPEHVAQRRAAVGDALTAAHKALREGPDWPPTKAYYIYVPDNADVAVTRALDPRDVQEFGNLPGVRGRPNIIVRPKDGTEAIGPVR